MKFGIELVSVTELHIPQSSHFEIRATIDGLVVEGTAGRDEYRTAVTAAPGQRLAATGRLNIWDATLAPAFALRVRPAYLVPVTIRPHAHVGFVLRTSLPLGQGEVQAGMMARVVSAGAKSPTEIPLARPGVAVGWEGRGRFRVDLGPWPFSRNQRGGGNR